MSDSGEQLAHMVTGDFNNRLSCAHFAGKNGPIVRTLKNREEKWRLHPGPVRAIIPSVFTP